MSETSGLIEQLNKATSLQQQLKILIRNWRTVRALTSDQRMEVAAHVGLREAGTLLEQLGKKGGVAPTVLLRAVRKAEQRDPKELARLVRTLRKTEARKKWVEDRLGELGEAVVGPPTVPGEATKNPPPAPAQSSPEKGADPAPPPVPRPVPSETAARAAKKIPEKERGQVAEPESAGKKEVPAEPAAVVGTASASEQEKPPDGKPPVSPAARSERPSRAEPAGPDQSGRRREDRRKPPQTEEPVVAAPGGFLEELEQCPFLLSRLRRLDDAPPLSTTDLDRLLREFPPGWARGRAARKLIRGGRIESEEQIRTLFDLLETPLSQMWCVSELRGRTSPGGLDFLRSRLLSKQARRLLDRPLREKR